MSSDSTSFDESLQALYTTHGAFSWGELQTTDPAAAKAFYEQLLDWQIEEGPFHGMTYYVVKPKSAGEKGSIAGITSMPPNAPAGMPPSWGQYITVNNIDETVEKAQELGGKVLFGPHDIPEVGRFALIQDPQGAMVSCITYAPKG